MTIALAILGAVVAAGTVQAGGGQSLVGAGSSDVGLEVPGGEELPPADAPQCSNSVDDDGDGAVDTADGDCSSSLDDSEGAATIGGGGGGGSGDPDVPPPPDDGAQPLPPPVTDSGNGGGGNGGTDDGVPGPGGNGGRGGGGDQVGGGNGGGESGGARAHERDRNGVERRPVRKPDGTPTKHNPTVTVADFGAAPIGVPNFVIDQFTIPPFLLPIYQACGTQYGIPWQVLASINRIETAFGTNLNVSTAGAVGWMQFLPSTWRAYGVDANSDERKDPYNPVDAICGAARYLNAAGGEEDLRAAIFAYNHADWYVDEVLLYAKQYGNLPDDVVGSLTGLTEGARFPIAADARYADDISERRALKRSKTGARAAGNAADVVSSSPTRRGINIYSRDGAPVVAVNDGVIKRMGHSKRLGDYLVLEDAYGNRFTYAQMAHVSRVYPVPKEHRLTAADFKLVSPGDERAPEHAASAGSNRAKGHRALASDRGPLNTEDVRRRLFAFPERRHNIDRAGLTGQLDHLLKQRFPGYESFKSYFSGVLKFDRKQMALRPLRKGSKVVAGTVLGRVGKTDELAPHLNFSIRPAGRGAPRIDPKPILDGWKLLEATAIYRAAGKNPFEGAASTGQVLLMSKEQAERRVLADPRLEIYECGRQDIRTGQVDARVLRMLEYLAERGFRLTITSLKCGHGTYTASGNVSEHASGNAVDIAMINGQPILGHQGPGTLAYALVRDVLQLQGTMEPHQVISLMDFGGPSFAMADHADHVHVGFQPQYGPGSDVDKQFAQILKPDQWQRLIGRIADIDNPKVPTETSRFAIPAKKHAKGKDSKRASRAHVGE